MQTIKMWMLKKPHDINRSAMIWNMFGTILMSLQSVLMLALVNRICSLEVSGIFSIAITLANQFLILGNYAMRTFQASDITETYNYHDYLKMRYLTVGAMIVLSISYVVYMYLSNEYDIFKSYIIVLTCFLRCIDAIEDVINGRYHQKGRLDISAKCQIIRQLATLVTFIVVLIAVKNIMTALMISIAFSLLTLLGTTILLKETFDNNIPAKFDNVKKLLWKCCPLFLSTFLYTYICNASKYVIDRKLSEESQAIFGFLYMPVFVLNLLSGLIYNPFIFKFSLMWQDKKQKPLFKEILKYTVIILGFSAVGLVFASILGTPVLSVLYGIDLKVYQKEFIVLMTGSVFLALIGFVNVMLTIFRKQFVVFFIYLASAVFATFAAESLVSNFDLLGAAWSYTIVLFVIAIVLYVYMCACVLSKGE